jgi:hypothetical protein
MCRLPGNGGGVCWREEGGVGRVASAGRRPRVGLGRGGILLCGSAPSPAWHPLPSFDRPLTPAHNIVAATADSS